MEYIDAIKEFIQDIWNDFIEFMLELPKLILKGIMDAIVYVVDLIPSPDFMTDYVLSDIIPSDLIWILNQIGFGEGLLIIGGGVLFFFLRRVTTLGIW